VAGSALVAAVLLGLAAHYCKSCRRGQQAPSVAPVGVQAPSVAPVAVQAARRGGAGTAEGDAQLAVPIGSGGTRAAGAADCDERRVP
jgi:hypothetical protein